MKYQAVIGLEIHSELLTRSKVFCTCENTFGGEINTRVCPICSAFPGTLPTINREAVELAVRAGLVLNCTISNYTTFDRKNYFYPDLPKAYQITQLENPICTSGYMDLEGGKSVRINNIHIEEDAGKLSHNGDISLADYNRCGVPLIEIVTEPDFSTAEETCEFVRKLALRLKYADICDVKMEQGSLRVDVNISVMPINSNTLGTRAEIKNLNSFKSITNAIKYETNRQIKILDSGCKVERETRRYNEEKGITESLRAKEDIQDYRYFPEPDIPPILITNGEIESIRQSIPEMPEQRFKRYVEKYKLAIYDAELIIQEKAFSDFYDEAVAIYGNYKQTANLMHVELNRNLNENNKNIAEISILPSDIAEIVKMTDDGIVSQNSAKEILRKMFFGGGSPVEIAEKNGFILNNDMGAVNEMVETFLTKHSSLVEEYKNGNEKVLGYLMGQFLRENGKSFNPKIIKQELMRKMKS